MIRGGIFILLFCLTKNPVHAASNTSCHVIKTDVLHFWQAYDSLAKNKDTLSVFNEIVFNQSSGAYTLFCKKWNITALNLKNQLARFPKYYASIRERSIQLVNDENAIQHLVQRFASLYKNFKGADICLAFGNFRTGGNIEITSNCNYVYVGMEFHTGGSNVQYDELPPFLTQYLINGSFYHTLVHELVHIQQFTHGSKIIKTLQRPSLEAHVLMEGVPDYIAELVCNQPLQNERYVYGLKNVNQLLFEFRKQKKSTNHVHWFAKPREKMLPDMGYFIGYYLASNYAKHHVKVQGDLTPLIEIKHIRTFIRKSQALQIFQWPFKQKV